MNIDKYIGILYKSLGRDLKGADCYGLVRVFYRNEFGIRLPSLDGRYTNSEDGDQTSKTASEEISARWKEVNEPKSGDVVVFKMQKLQTHIGVIINGSTFLHILKGRNSCVERLSHVVWRNRICGFYSYLGGRL